MSNNNKNKHVDPVENAESVKDAKDELQVIDPSDLSFSDFESIPEKRVEQSPAFEGYPLAPGVVIGQDEKGKDVEVSATYIVALNRLAKQPAQDISGQKVTIINLKTKKEERHTIASSHTRVIRDFEDGGRNDTTVFDRELMTKDGPLKYAVVKSHSVRAQIGFKMDPKTNKVSSDDRYLFLDKKQNGRLQKVFYSQIAKRAIEVGKRITRFENDEES